MNLINKLKNIFKSKKQKEIEKACKCKYCQQTQTMLGKYQKPTEQTDEINKD